MKNWHLSPVPDVATPRSVRVSSPYKKTFVLFLIVDLMLIWFWSALSLFCLVGLSLVWILMVLQLKKERWFLAWGSVSSAHIVDEVEYGRRGTFKTFSRIIYSFVDADGHTVEGIAKGIPTKWGTNDKDIERRVLFLGRPIVLFDPDDSTRSILYPLDSVELG